MVTRRVSEDFHGLLANASGHLYTQLQKLIYPVTNKQTLVLIAISIRPFLKRRLK